MLSASAWIGWNQAWRTAEAEVASASDAAAQYARRLFEGQLLRIGRANDALAGLTDGQIRLREAELHDALRGIAAEREPAERETFYMFVYDRNAFGLVASSVFPVAATRPMVDRDFNHALRAPDAPPFHVSQVYVGRDTGRPFFAVSARRVGTGNGLAPDAYDGVINASVFVDRVNPVLRELGVAERDVVSLVRVDGAVLARSAGFGDRGAEGLRIGDKSPMLPLMARGEERALAHAASTLDGVERVVAYRKVGGAWPVYAAVARDRATVVAAWRRDMVPQAALALASTALLLLLTTMLARHQAALVAANASLEARVADRTAALAENERFLRLAQQAAGAGSWSWRPDIGEILVSPELLAMLGLEATETGPVPFDGFMEAVHPEDRALLEQALVKALREGQMALELRVFRRLPDGGREERWFLCRARLFGSPDDGSLTLFGVDLDITDRRRAEERFEASTEAMEGFVYDADLSTGRVLHSCGITGLGLGPSGTRASTWMALTHPEDRPRLDAEMRPLLADPKADRYALEYRVRRQDGSYIWVLDRGRIFRDGVTGAATRLVGGAVDITARRDAEERQILLMREVDHRAKNALAVVGAALRLTRADDVEAYRTAIESRVAALARAQAALAESSWLGADLRGLVAAALEAFIGEGKAPRAVLRGPPVTLAAEATQALSMALHELATNATKYGALSRAEGSVRVTWRLAEERLLIRWEETGGPPVEAQPGRRGFGTRVIDGTVRTQLGGEARLDWRPEGLVAELSIPAGRALARTQRAA
jgi:PAS domain S-box-containing protein